MTLNCYKLISCYIYLILRFYKVVNRTGKTQTEVEPATATWSQHQSDDALLSFLLTERGKCRLFHKIIPHSLQ